MSIKITTIPPKGMKPIDVCRACAKLIRPYMKQKFMGPIYYSDFMGCLKNKSVLLALKKNEIIGFLQWNGFKRNKTLLSLHKLAVHTNYLHKGIGSKLLIEFLKTAGEKDIRLQVSKVNDAAVNFYKRHDFRQTKELKITFEMFKPYHTNKFDTFFQS